MSIVKVYKLDGNMYCTIFKTSPINDNRVYVDGEEIDQTKQLYTFELNETQQHKMHCIVVQHVPHFFVPFDKLENTTENVSSFFTPVISSDLPYIQKKPSVKDDFFVLPKFPSGGIRTDIKSELQKTIGTSCKNNALATDFNPRDLCSTSEPNFEDSFVPIMSEPTLDFKEQFD